MAALPDAADRPRARRLRAAPRRAASSRACPRTWPSGWRCCPPAYMLLGIVETADRDDRRPDRGRPRALRARRAARPADCWSRRILALPRDDRWQTMARAALRDDLHAVHAQLTAQVLAATEPDQPVPARVAELGGGATPWWCEPGGADAGGDLRRRAAPTWPGSRWGCGSSGRSSRPPARWGSSGRRQGQHEVAVALAALAHLAADRVREPPGQPEPQPRPSRVRAVAGLEDVRAPVRLDTGPSSSTCSSTLRSPAVTCTRTVARRVPQRVLQQRVQRRDDHRQRRRDGRPVAGVGSTSRSTPGREGACSRTWSSTSRGRQSCSSACAERATASMVPIEASSGPSPPGSRSGTPRGRRRGLARAGRAAPRCGSPTAGCGARGRPRR